MIYWYNLTASAVTVRCERSETVKSAPSTGASWWSWWSCECLCIILFSSPTRQSLPLFIGPLHSQIASFISVVVLVILLILWMVMASSVWPYYWSCEWLWPRHECDLAPDNNLVNFCSISGAPQLQSCSWPQLRSSRSAQVVPGSDQLHNYGQPSRFGGKPEITTDIE